MNQSDILWTGDAEKAWDDAIDGSRWPNNNEWVGYSCADRSRFSQVTSPVAQGDRAYRIEVRDGDDSYGERCELENGNTSSNRLHERILFHRGQDAWIAFQTYLPTDFSFAGPGDPVSFPGDGGLLMQLKQLGSCGTPALGIVTGKAVFAMRNSAGNSCESGAMKSLWTVPMVLGRWVRWVVNVKFDPDPEVGYTATWYDPDGLGLRPIVPRVDLGKPVEGNRIYTHTQKSPTDHPDPACPRGRPLLARAHRDLPRSRRVRHVRDLPRRLDGGADPRRRGGQRLQEVRNGTSRYMRHGRPWRRPCPVTAFPLMGEGEERSQR